MKAKPVLLKPRLSSLITLNFLFLTLDLRPWICGSYPGRGLGPSSITSSWYYRKDTGVSCYYLCPELFWALDIFLFLFYKQKCYVWPPKKILTWATKEDETSTPNWVSSLKIHDADSPQQREFIKLYLLCLYYENLVLKLWHSVTIWNSVSKYTCISSYECWYILGNADP